MLSLPFIGLTVLLLYIYWGYPALLAIFARVFSRKHVIDENLDLDVSIVISAHNEASVIRAKIENTLSLDYPKHKLKIWVVSDASSDATDDIVNSYIDKGVSLLRQQQRRGKTAGIDKVLSLITSEIIIFSDANAIYDVRAVRKLVRHFADPQVGYVVGYARYSDKESRSSEAGRTESVYWNLEYRTRIWESKLNSVVGGDGAIYAIRRTLYQPLLDSDINDFVNPLQIVVQGYRGIFDPEAFCLESPAGDFEKEFRRKVRIVNRSFNGVLRVPQSCNPLRVGWFAWQLVSHKLLRWFSPFFLLAHFLVALSIDRQNPLWPASLVCVAGYLGLIALSLVGCCRMFRNCRSSPVYYFPLYFVLVNCASAAGILLRFGGKIITTWGTVREESHPKTSAEAFSEYFLMLGLLSIISSVRIIFWTGVAEEFLIFSFFISLGCLCYAYVGYPLLLTLLSWLFRVNVKKDPGYLPSVTLLVPAFNEEQTIRNKVANCLGLDYPEEKLRILVVSDGSTDRTASIVKEFPSERVELHSFLRNRGKIAVINEVMRLIDSEIVVFSDANVMFERNAVRKLVCSFGDSRVGAVSGKVILRQEGLSYACSEQLYYRIEHYIQEKEGGTGGVIGADGAMYAIRRRLFIEPPPNTILDDFVISMNILCAGHLLVFEKEAVAYEENVVEIAGEFRRKVRIIAGGIQCLKTGHGMPKLGRPWVWFKFFSHKVLRWLSGLLAIVSVFSGLSLILRDESSIWTYCGVSTFLVISVVGLMAHYSGRFRQAWPANYIYYILMLNVASLSGCYKGWTGRQQVTWRAA